LHFLSFPYQALSAQPFRIPGALLLGDALNMRHPLTGAGMSVALTDVHHLLTLLPSQKTLTSLATMDEKRAACAKVAETFYETRGAPNVTVNVLADALYMIFGGLDTLEKKRLGLAESGPMTEVAADLRSACFAYLGQGGMFLYDPTCLLAIVNRNPLSLIGHFFAVAFFAMYQLLLPVPSPWRVVRAFNALRGAVRIIDPLLMREHPPWPLAFLIAAARLVFWLPTRTASSFSMSPN
jgi:squalene monooxygenase